MKLGLLLLIGIPGSGKTTLARKLKDEYNFYNYNSYHFIHVCYDEFITFQNVLDIEWKSARNSISSTVENLIKSIKNNTSDSCPEVFKNDLNSINDYSKIVLILDDNMYYKSMRYSLYQIAKNHNISFCQVYLNCTVENALLNNSTRESHEIVPPHVIEKMYEKMEKPDGKNFWERFSIEINAFGDTNSFIHKLFFTLDESLENVAYNICDNEEQKQLCIQQCKTNVIHQTDIVLRNIVGLKIKEYLKENKNSKELSLILNNRKSEILADIKAGNICLPDEVLEGIKNNCFEKSALVNFLESYF